MEGALVDAQLREAREMRSRLAALRFSSPVVCVYNPLDYAWEAFSEYVTRYGGASGRVLFLGMNPGPWGMAQTGVPFGEVSVVRDWLGIRAPIGRPADEHPAYPVRGYDCTRSEVSGARLWGLFRARFGTPGRFFAGHFVMNYCPLLFVASKTLKSGRAGASNLTPDKLPREEREALLDLCDAHLRAVVGVLSPRCVIGIGAFAEARARTALGGVSAPIHRILHPSPASPKSNADWAGTATRQLEAHGVF